ncbi:hypothetical protein [Nonomuraea basaltis]|uniref:hypothetical protein n=1 Tax=Nonomuraea basaltis TaxID=2495887 RepID=UPI001485F209|nr:hypothetical protein [Nonomuraea basaltis]
MEIIEVTADQITVRLGPDGAGTINNALNEVCNGAHLDKRDFQTRMGVVREEARDDRRCECLQGRYPSAGSHSASASASVSPLRAAILRRTRTCALVCGRYFGSLPQPQVSKPS